MTTAGGVPVDPAVARATAIPALLRALVASDPGRPRITWYDDAPGPTRGERIELSARVLANWVAKAANFLVDELDVERGDRVRVDLPTHWRATYWLLASWSVGAEVVVGASDEREARVVVTDDPASVAPGGTATVVAVTLPALARTWAGAPLPAGAVDEAATLTGQPDVFDADEPDGQAVALRTGGRAVTYAELLSAARVVSAGWPAQARVLVSTDAADAVAGLLAPLTVDGSLVLVRDPDPALADERRAAERVTSA